MTSYPTPKQRVLLSIFLAFLALVIITCILVAVFPKHTTTYSAIIEMDKADDYTINIDSVNSTHYTTHMSEFIKPYEEVEIGGNIIDCSKRQSLNSSEVCLFKASWLDDCHKGNGWGFADLKPCIILTFSPDSTYKPKPYKTLDQLPPNMPKELRKEIVEAYKEEDKMFEQIWVYCTNTSYYAPQQGFMEQKFYNRHLPEYLTPLVGVQFDLTKKDYICSECSLWDQNTPGTYKVSINLINSSKIKTIFKQ